MTPRRTSLLLPFACTHQFKLILHVNAAAAHYQISLACLCIIGSSNVSEWDPGSESTSEPMLEQGSINWSGFVSACVYMCMLILWWEVGGACASLCAGLIWCRESERSIFGWQCVCVCVFGWGHYAKRCIIWGKGSISLSKKLGLRWTTFCVCVAMCVCWTRPNTSSEWKEEKVTGRGRERWGRKEMQIKLVKFFAHWLY